jgi:hypothetical protein
MYIRKVAFYISLALQNKSLQCVPNGTSFVIPPCRLKREEKGRQKPKIVVRAIALILLRKELWRLLEMTEKLTEKQKAKLREAIEISKDIQSHLGEMSQIRKQIAQEESPS